MPLPPEPDELVAGPAAAWRFVAPPPSSALSPGRAPTFSVVIAAYQAAETIAEAVESALAQTQPALEVIVCDDGSTDGLRAALRSVEDKIVLLHKPHGGAASARNAAVRRATGEFVAQLDSDDVFLPHRLEALGALASARPDLDILATDAYFEVEGEIAGRFHDVNPFVTEDQRTGILERCFFGWPAVRRERLLAVGGFDEALVTADDWEAWIRLILSGSSAGLVDAPLLRYRLRRGSLSARRAEALRERVTVLDRVARYASLTEDEQHALRRFRAERARRATVAEAEAAVRSDAPDARRRALAVVRGAGFSVRARAAYAFVSLSPLAARRALEWRDRRRGPRRGADGRFGASD